ncbi:MAG TPA: DUF1552 domain-containing protein [Labilithrix sp.]|nr:DUF1552 domain-containing protein [Labilithrix sp.]
MSAKIRRRAFLAGAGTLLALPMLESALPRTARADTPPPAPRRFMTFHFPIGVNRAAWKPSGTESSWTLGDTQTPLAAHKDDITVITNVDASGDKSNASVHTGRIATFLTAADVPLGIPAMGTSADQVIAASLAGKTPFKSLELGTSILNENPNKEPGYDPVLKDHLSWSNGTPLPKEINPSALFDRLFAWNSNDPSAAKKRRELQQSVIDAVRDDATRLKRQLGKSDHVKLDEYLTGVRELEVRIQATAGTCAAGTRPGPPVDIRDRVKQMIDLSVLAFRCDLTRVITFGYEHTVTEQTHPWLGVTEGYHIGITHNQPGAQYAAVNKWIVSQLAYLLDQLKATKDASGSSLLDSSIVYFASEMGEGSSHSTKDIPIIVCGGGGGRIRKGRLLDRPGQGNGNVLISLMQAMDVQVSSFGNGFTAPLPGLLNG